MREMCSKEKKTGHSSGMTHHGNDPTQRPQRMGWKWAGYFPHVQLKITSVLGKEIGSELETKDPVVKPSTYAEMFKCVLSFKKFWGT